MPGARVGEKSIPYSIRIIIQLLNERRLIDKVNFDDGFVRYERGHALDSGRRHRHHHLICIKCGRVIPFQEDLLEELEKEITRTTGFCVVDHETKESSVNKVHLRMIPANSQRTRISRNCP